MIRQSLSINLIKKTKTIVITHTIHVIKLTTSKHILHPDSDPVVQILYLLRFHCSFAAIRVERDTLGSPAPGRGVLFSMKV